MTAGRRIGEYARRAAARGTKQVLLRRGRELDMVLGVGFPKSGTVWLCQLLGTALGVPYPREYRSPIAMSSIIHAHWRYDPRFPPAAYIQRDGRDVMVSMYFYYVRALGIDGKPARARQLREMFESIYGPSFDPSAVRANLPRFIETQVEAPRSSDGLAWHQHVADWHERPGVAEVAYEELLAAPVPAVARLMGELGREPDEHIAQLTVDRWSKATTSGRTTATEDRTSFLRKGVAGDWREHFTVEAGEVFDAVAGDMLVELGYAADRDWYRGL